MRQRVRVLAHAAFVSLFVLGVASPAHADSYEDEDEDVTEPSPDGDADAEDPPAEETLSAGGLEAPGNFAADAEEDEVTRELEEADRRDSQRGLEFAWLVGEVGLGVVDAGGLDRGDLLAPDAASGGVGVAYGGGLGVRLLYFTLGARVTGAAVDALQTLGVSGELGMKIPLGNLEPLFMLDIGYVGVSGLASEQAQGGLKGVDGLGLNLGAGVDYYLSDHFSLGGSLRFGALFLGRPAQDPANFGGVMDPIYASGASSIGTSLSLALRIGFHL